MGIFSTLDYGLTDVADLKIIRGAKKGAFRGHKNEKEFVMPLDFLG